MYQFVRRHYYDLRLAWSMISPLIGFVNFVLIFYNFTKLKEQISFDYFIVLLVIGSGLVLLIIGKTLRKNQLSTDMNLIYEQSTENAKTARLQLEIMIRMLERLRMDIPDEMYQRISYLKSIENRK